MLHQSGGSNALLIGQTAPDFTLPDAEGEFVTLMDFRGCKVLLVFLRHFA